MFRYFPFQFYEYFRWLIFLSFLQKNIFVTFNYCIAPILSIFHAIIMTPIFEYVILKLDRLTTNERKKKGTNITLLKIYEFNTLGKTSLQRCFTSNTFYTAFFLIFLFYSLNKKKENSNAKEQLKNRGRYITFQPFTFSYHFFFTSIIFLKAFL